MRIPQSAVDRISNKLFSNNSSTAYRPNRRRLQIHETNQNTIMLNAFADSNTNKETSLTTENPPLSEQQQDSVDIHDPSSNTTTPSNDSTNNYPMTPNTSDSNQDSNTNDTNNTDKLVDQVDTLIEQLEMERVNNTYALDLLADERSHNHTNVASLHQQIALLEQQLTSLTTNQPPSTSSIHATPTSTTTPNPPFPSPPDPSKGHLPPSINPTPTTSNPPQTPPPVPNQFAPPPPMPTQIPPPNPQSSHHPSPSPPNTNMFFMQLFQQQQQMFNMQMDQTNTMMQQFTTSMTALQQSTVQNAKATQQQVLDARDKQIKKGPTNNKFPKFGNKSNENFMDWYDDVLCVLALSEWKEIYDSSLNDICACTTPSNESLSEHLYMSLRIALTDDAGSIMKNNRDTYRNKGIEFLHSMHPIFNPKWPTILHSSKLTAFCNLFRKPDETIDDFANNFKRSLRELRYNDIVIPPSTAKHSFLQGLGSEFIPIRNMAELPTAFQPDNIDSLTMAARDHLARVLGNRAIQKQQQRLIQQQRSNNSNHRNNSNTNTHTQSSPPSTTPSPAPASTPTSASRPTPPPNQQQTVYQQQTDFQREIMREIGFRAHTPTRIAFWQQLAGPGMCYYHRLPHSSSTCTRLQRAQQRANNGTVPTSTFIPNPRFSTPITPTTNPSPRPPPNPSPMPTPTPPTTPSARHVTTEVPSDSDSSHNAPVELNSSNFDADYYPPDSNNSVDVSSPHIHHRFVVDSGATEHMCSIREMFSTIRTPTPSDPTFVKLGDGATKCAVMGIGTIQLMVQTKVIRLHDVLYVPDIEDSLFSIKTHMRFQGCYEHSENNQCTIAFPTFTIDAITNNDIEFYANTSSASHPDFDDRQATLNIPQNTIPYTRSSNTNDHVQISSIYKTKPIKHPPTMSTSSSAGFDLHSAITTSIPPNSRKAIGLGFNIAIPEGMYGRIAPRSGLALHHHLDVAAGVIDPDYRGEVKVLLVNSSQKQFKIQEGDRIAQLIFERIATPAFHTLASLPTSKRGKGGFGSTGSSANHATPTNTPRDTPLSPTPSAPTTSPSATPPSSTPNASTPSSTTPLNHDPPQIRPVDKPQPVVPPDKTIIIEDLRKIVGFRNAE